MNSLYQKIDDMTWPVPGERMDDIEYALRYQHDLDRNTLAAAASIISAYRELVMCSQKKRNYISGRLKEEPET